MDDVIVALRLAGAACVALALLALGGTAEARPRKRDAKAQFDRGLAAYKKSNYEGAAQALARSYELEADLDTLFAWAQAERKLERCDRAIELYEKLLTSDMPAANRDAIERSISDCRAVIAAQAPPPPPAPAPPALVPPRPEPAAAPVPLAVAPPPAPPPPATRAWYRDPVALTLVGVGLITTGVGAGLVVSAHSLDQDFHHATTESDALSLRDQARSRGTAGVITASVGGALVLGGVVWIATHRTTSEPRTLTGWLSSDGAGLAFIGAF